MLRGKCISFSPGGEKLASGSKDGVLRIWDTASGRLEQEYQPAEHLTAAPSCIRFSPVETKNLKKSTPGKKKVREDVKRSLLAMGTNAGTVLVYSPEKSEVLVCLSHAPPHSILDLAWHSPTRLFSLAADNTLVEWNVVTGSRVMSCEVENGTSICALDKKNICIGKSKIQHLTLSKKTNEAELKRVFTGHTSKVSVLIPIPSSEEGAKYFLSAALDDRFIYAWNTSSESGDSSASFSVGDRVLSMTVSAAGQDNTVALAATTRKGFLVYFTQHLNGNLEKKIIKRTGKLRIKCEGVQDKTLPIHCSYFLNDSENTLIIAYGNSDIFKFERIKVKDLCEDQELVRSNPVTITRQETALVNIHTPKVTKDAVLLGPGHLATPAKSETKRKRGDEDGKESLPMEERLNALAIDKTASKGQTQQLKADNQVHLLLQGLHSKDTRLLQPVLSCKDSEVISDTVRRLPTQAVVPLLKHLHLVITGKGIKSCAYVQWVRSILYHHMSHLSTLPDREALVAPFYGVAAGRMASLIQLTQLHARLDLMLTHVATRHQEAQQQHDHQPLLLYQEESSGEEDLADGMMGVSESEDNWDEFSDIEVNGHSDDSDMEVNQTTSKRRLDDDDSDNDEEDEEGIDDEDGEGDDSEEEEITNNVNDGGENEDEDESSEDGDDEEEEESDG